MSAAEFWDDMFKSSSGFKTEPNQLLMIRSRREAGAALDLLMGQGRNALYIASQGWKVTGVDVSPVGIKLAKEHAEQRKLKLDAIEVDIDKYDLGRTGGIW